MTNLSVRASLSPLHSRIGVILVIGFDGPMTTTSLASTAWITSSVLSGCVFEHRTTSSIRIWPLDRIQVLLVVDQAQFSFYLGCDFSIRHR